MDRVLGALPRPPQEEEEEEKLTAVARKAESMEAAPLRSGKC
jgi:hypothetical protein